MNALLGDAILLAYVNSIRRSSEFNIKKEIALNLIEDMLTLYIRVRSHSYAKDQKQNHKMTKSSLKKNSLRTELKKSS